MASTSAAEECLPKTNPVESLLSASITVSTRPPIALTTGGVPYRMAIICQSPQGSYREGMRNMSEPAYMRCARGSLNPVLKNKLKGFFFASIENLL